MPKIFSAAKKQALSELLKQNCMHLIREHGYKGVNIKALTRMTGISSGTFYHFYPSKEALITALMSDCQHSLQERFANQYKEKGGVGREDFIALYYTFFAEDKNNIFSYLKREDLASLLLCSDKKLSWDLVKNTMSGNIKFLENPKKNINLNAVVNFTQLLNFCLENRDFMVKEELPNTLKKLLENLADEIFEQEA